MAFSQKKKHVIIIIDSCRVPMASRLVKSDRLPCERSVFDRLGGSSWLLWNYFIAEFNEMREIYFWRHLCCAEGELESTCGPAVYKNIAEFNEIEEFVPVQWGSLGQTTTPDDQQMRKGKQAGRLYGRLDESTCVTCSAKTLTIGPEREKTP